MPQRAEPIRADDPAVAILYERYAEGIFTFLRARTAAVADAEDVLTEVFIAALEGNRLLGIPEAARLAWLRRVAANKLADYHRQRQRQTHFTLNEMADELPDDAPTPEELTLFWEEHDALREAVQQLPPLQQTLLQLRFAEGLVNAEIAARLGKSEEAVRQLLSRTLRYLRTLYHT